MAKKKHWFDVTVKETYHATYKILAEDQDEAYDMANDMVNCGDIDPTNDAEDSYDREVDVDGASAPKNGEEYWRREDSDDSCACNYVWLGDDGLKEHKKCAKKAKPRAKSK